MITQAAVIGVEGFGQDRYTIRAIQWAYDFDREYLILLLLGEDIHIPLKICSLPNVIPKEFVLKVTKDKRKIRKAPWRDLGEKRLEDRHDTLIEAAQRIFDSKKETWTKDELIKFFQGMEI